MGKLVGADAILTGTIDDHGMTVTVYARIIDIERGFVLATASVNISKIGLPEEIWEPKILEQAPALSLTSKAQALPEKLTLGVTPYLSQKKLEDMFLPVLDYLHHKTGIQMDLVIVSDYGKLAERMKTNDIDIGIFSPFAYIEGVKQANVKIFASQLTNGRSSYQGLIITKKGNRIKTLADLKNKSFAFVDPKSTSGYIYPRVMLIEHGYNPATFFRNTIFAGSHDNALQSVLSGRCDAGAVFEDVINDALETELNIIAKTDKIPYDAYTARPGISERVIQRIQKELISLDLKTENQGVRVLTGPINGFIIAGDKDYDSVRKISSFRADRPTAIILSFREIGRFQTSFAETACELLKNKVLSKNNYNIISSMENQAISDLNAAGSQAISEKELKVLEKHGIQFVISGSVIHLGENLNVSVKLHSVPSGAIVSAFTRSGKPSDIEKIISSLAGEINDVTPVTGYVITVEGNTFITDFGSDSGVSEGDRILVYKEGKPIVNPLTGVILGKNEIGLAEGTVISITPTVSVCKICSGKAGRVQFGKRCRTLRKTEFPSSN